VERTAAACAAAVALLCGAGGHADPELPRVVVYDGAFGYHHSSIEPGDAVLEQLAADGAFELVKITSDPADFTPQLYQRADVFVWNSATGEIPLTAQQKIDYIDFHLCGGGYAGVHASTDANYEWPEYGELTGAWFQTHPHLGYCQGDFTSPQPPCEGDGTNDFPQVYGGNATLLVEDQVHGATAPWHGSASFRWADEYYLFRDRDGDPLTADPRGEQDVHVLLSLEESTTMAPPAYPHHQPLAWTKTFRGAGRVFYTNLGHNTYSWQHPSFQQHLLGGLDWVAEVRPDRECVAEILDRDEVVAGDNCPLAANPGQEDRGGVATSAPDGIGDACQCGDVTGNGIVNGQDVNAIKRHAMGIEPNPLFLVPGNCDVTGNGRCDGQDANAVKRAVLGAQPNPLFGQHCHNATGDPVPADL
jgi:type 1 glutamine amidotransferase